MREQGEDELDNKAPRCLIDRSSPNRRAGLLGFGLLIPPGRGTSAPQAPIDIKAAASLLLPPSTRLTYVLEGIIAYSVRSILDYQPPLCSFLASVRIRPLSTTSQGIRIRQTSCDSLGCNSLDELRVILHTPHSIY